MGNKEIKGEYKRGRSNQYQTGQNFVRLAGSWIYVIDPEARGGTRRISKNKTVYVKNIEGVEGIAFWDEMPYRVFLQNGKWIKGEIAAEAEVLAV